MSQNEPLLSWLMDGDPAIRWQVQRDLLAQDASVWEAERAKVATQGWGARYLALQEKDGKWGGGNYSPKYISTHYTLLTLRRIGLPPKHPQAFKACEQLITSHMLFSLGNGFPEVKGKQPDICVLGMKLSMFAYFRFEDERVHTIASYLLDNIMDDQGWNCRHWYGATHSSFHSTLSVMEGLLEYQRAYPNSDLPLSRSQAAGREFLLQHRLYKSHRTGEIVKEAMTRFPFPPQWHYDFLKALDYFQNAGAEKDERLQDAIELLLSRQKPEGHWPNYRTPSKHHFSMETPSKPSRWNTLRALRVLKWWDKSS
jgi:hypothetical protein